MRSRQHKNTIVGFEDARIALEVGANVMVIVTMNSAIVETLQERCLGPQKGYTIQGEATTQAIAIKRLMTIGRAARTNGGNKDLAGERGSETRTTARNIEHLKTRLLEDNWANVTKQRRVGTNKAIQNDSNKVVNKKIGSFLGIPRQHPPPKANKWEEDSYWRHQ